MHNMRSSILLYPLYYGQGCGGAIAYPENTGSGKRIHSEYDASPSQQITHTRTYSFISAVDESSKSTTGVFLRGGWKPQQHRQCSVKGPLPVVGYT